MHGLAESKWSKQRSGPQFFSTKVEPPTAPAETVLDSVPGSAQMAFSSPRATLREADESHPSPKLATSADLPGSHSHPHPLPSSAQGAAGTVPARASTAQPVQESIATPRASPSLSTAAPRAPPKANGGNPWAAFAMAADPEGQAQDGRSYVGGRSYIVDKPAATSTAQNHPSKPFPPPQNKIPKPQINPPKLFSLPQNNANQRPGPNSAGSGWNSSSTSASQQSWPQSPQSQNNSSQRSGPTSTTSGWNSTSSASAIQKPWTQPPRSATRPPVENRWAGKPLATTAMFTDDFFSTAKPRTQAPSATSLASAMDRQNQGQSQTSNGWPDQGNMDNNFTQKQDFTTNTHTRPGFSAESKPAPAQSWGEHKQQQASRWQMYEQQQQQQEQQQQEREQEQEREQAQQQQGQQQQPSQRQSHQPLQPPTYQSYQQQIRSNPINGHKELSNAWPVEDGGNITYPQPSAVNNESGRTSRMDAGSDIPDDPLFLQYPIGDGCHVVVAMYVERTAEAAASRFPTMTRKRQESSWKQKSVDEVATIFKQALTEEKKDVTG